jgi:CubicO group peptidase (beta-lactamase class C family)
MVTINGFMKSGFESVGEALAQNFNDDFEVGASVSVVYQGETVVDIWAGHADLERTAPWERDTITNVWSSTNTPLVYPDGIVR